MCLQTASLPAVMVHNGKSSGSLTLVAKPFSLCSQLVAGIARYAATYMQDICSLNIHILCAVHSDVTSRKSFTTAVSKSPGIARYANGNTLSPALLHLGKCHCFPQIRINVT